MNMYIYIVNITYISLSASISSPPLSPLFQGGAKNVTYISVGEGVVNKCKLYPPGVGPKHGFSWVGGGSKKVSWTGAAWTTYILIHFKPILPLQMNVS